MPSKKFSLLISAKKRARGMGRRPHYASVLRRPVSDENLKKTLIVGNEKIGQKRRSDSKGER